MLKKPNPLIYEIKIIYYLISPLPHSADSTPTVTFCNSISKVYKYFLLGFHPSVTTGKSISLHY